MSNHNKGTGKGHILDSSKERIKATLVKLFDGQPRLGVISKVETLK